MTTMNCPNCGRRKDINFEVCLCGYDFKLGQSAPFESASNSLWSEANGEIIKPSDHLPATLERFMEDLKRGDTRQRQIAAHQLGKANDPTVVPALIEAYLDVNPTVRYYVLEGLRRIGGKEATEFITTLEIGDTAKQNRQYENSFIIGCGGWWITSLVVNFALIEMFYNYSVENQFKTLLLLGQALGLLITGMKLRKSKRLFLGIIFAATMVIFGIYFFTTCLPPGLPFPLNLFTGC